MGLATIDPHSHKVQPLVQTKLYKIPKFGVNRSKGFHPQNAFFFVKGVGDALAKSWDVPFSGSFPLDPSLTQSLEDSQALIDLFPDSPTLNAVKMITSKLVQMESNGDQ